LSTYSQTIQCTVLADFEQLTVSLNLLDWPLVHQALAPSGRVDAITFMS